MTPHERVRTAITGGTLDRKPIIVWSQSPGHDADCVAVGYESLRHALDTHPNQLVLAQVYSPIGRATRTSVPLLRIFEDNPLEGDKLLSEIALEAGNVIDLALEMGAAGIFYRLDGAYQSLMTPMQYGGHFLEHDRALLERAKGAEFNLLQIEGEEPIYFDAVSDLPAHAVTWNRHLTGLDIETARAAWPKAIALDQIEADMIFVKSYEMARDMLGDESSQK